MRNVSSENPNDVFDGKLTASIDRCEYVGAELRDFKTASGIETAPHDHPFV
jgi:hypothetical protein